MQGELTRQVFPGKSGGPPISPTNLILFIQHRYDDDDKDHCHQYDVDHYRYDSDNRHNFEDASDVKMLMIMSQRIRIVKIPRIM